MRLFNRKTVCGCAEAEDGELFFVSIKYDPHARCVEIASAAYGSAGDSAFVRGLARRYGSDPVWVPVGAVTAAQLSDIRIARVDDGDGLVRGARLESAMESQMRQVEADQKGDYMRVLASAEFNGRNCWIGGSIPRDLVESTFDTWRGRGFRKPLVASRHVAIANLFLALHPEAEELVAQRGREPDSRNRIIASWQSDADIFCYLRGNAIIDCGSSVAPSREAATFDWHMDCLGGWAGDFAHKHGVTEKDGFQAIVIAASGIQCPHDFQAGEALSMWSVPWEKSIKCATQEASAAVSAHPELAFRAIGLALHGA